MNRIKPALLMAGLAILVSLGQACSKSDEQPTQSSGPSGPAPITSATPPAAQNPSTAASQPAPAVAADQGSAGNPFAVRTSKLAAGTVLKARNDRTISTSSNATGDTFDGTLDQAIVINGVLIAPKGSVIHGKVVLSDKSGAKSGGVPTLVLALADLTIVNGDVLQLQTNNITVRPVGKGEQGKAGPGAMDSSRADEAEINGQSPLEFTLTAPVSVTSLVK